MVVFSNIKINLGLYVTSKRTDGYHNLETVFYTVPWLEPLEAIPANNLEIELSGLQILGDVNQNLCIKAYQLLSRDFQIPPVKFYLHKTVPTGSGLGAGSANGAFALKLLNNLFDLKLEQPDLERYALELGSDCPVFIANRPAYALGRGEVLTPLPHFLKGVFIAIVHPAIHISTREAFANLTPKPSNFDLITLPNINRADYPELLINHFEDYAINRYKVIGDIKESMYQSGAFYSSMSGSGSAVYGLFIVKADAEKLITQYANKFNARVFELD